MQAALPILQIQDGILMEYYYIAMLVFLAGLACFDLFVGVSNDAVNFLNSAMGSRIASFRTTMWVATFGVLLGATFSSGMMEIARSGIFHPQMFNFTEVMIIFFAVMIADVILLDAFNSLGLPTSTTVSIVFELLGSAIAAAAFKLYLDGGSMEMVFDFINTSKSLTIISGILISVVVAFVSGAVIQYIMRLIFSFHFERVYPYFGGVFGGLSITAIAYFLVMKGAKGASFMRPEWIDWIQVNTPMLVVTLFVGFSILFQILILVSKFNVFKIVILAGTFSLAFAFAGNDLVNFVGVPLAAYDSFKIWMASGAQPDDLQMKGLLISTKTDTFFLIASGLVMVYTLWFSKKAHRVLQTALNLSSQQSDHEQFGSSIPGRVIVRASMGLGNIVNQLIPGAVKKGLDSRFKHRRLKRGEEPLPFDYVRASVNLVLSAALISSATSLQLPLSTTYVTFMVAMGSSFADGAWDRETAVYRISGVLTVISGWFLTALTASTLAAVVCIVIFLGGFIAFVLALLAFFLIVRSNMRFNQQEANYKAEQAIRYDVEKIREILNQRVGENLLTTVTLYNNIVEMFLNDDEGGLRKLKLQANENFDQLTRERGVYYKMGNTAYVPTKEDNDARYSYFRTFTNLRDVGRSLQALSRVAKDHIANRHRTFQGELSQDLADLSQLLLEIVGNHNGKADVAALHANAQSLLTRIETIQEKLLRNGPDKGFSARGCELFLSFLLFARELINHYEIIAMLQQKLNAPLPEKAVENQSQTA